MIAERIFNGDSAGDIGLTESQYASRKATLDRYLAQSGGRFDQDDYRSWLRKDKVGDRGLQVPQAQGQEQAQPVSIKPQPSGCGCRNKRKPRQRPSKWTMLKNFGREVAKFAAAGFATVNLEEYKRRLTICENCSDFAADRRCDVCGCYMDVKALMATTDCQMGKWPKASANVKRV